MRRARWMLLAAVALLQAAAALAYELDTHATISESALLESRLGKDPELLKALGLGAVGDQVGGTGESVLTLVRRGARLEDDGTRALSHFLDPTRAAQPGNGALRFGFVTVPGAHSSPDWALEDRGQIGAQGNSLSDGRSWMLQALTSESKTDRDANFAMLFQTLGMVIHHIQDMAQPQHVRNDLHCIHPACKPFIHNPSAYENYTDKVQGTPAFPLTGYASVYAGPNVAVLNAARRFWYTGDGKGIAEFTQRNFVSDGTNFRYLSGEVLADRSYGFPLPSTSDEAVITIQQAYQTTGKSLPPEIRDFCGGGADCSIEFFGTSGVDQLTGVTFTNSRAASLSVFDHDLQLRKSTIPTSDGEVVYDTSRVFSLNSFNFDKAHEILVKRAVGYSAGLIDYFFRGKIDLVADPADSSRLLIKNLSAEPMKGKFALYYDNQAGTRGPVLEANGQALVWDTELLLPDAQGFLAAGASLPAGQIATPADARTLNEYMLVFTGDMGEEKADAEKGLVGAVVGKQIRNEYHGALYILGQQANGALVSLRVDRAGTQVIAAGAFNPLAGLYASTVNRPVRDKIHVYKQAEYGPGPTEYRTKMVSFRQVDNPNGRLTLFGTGLGRAALGIVWTARSPDPQIGSFEFTLDSISGDGRNAFVLFTRRFTNATGAEQTVASFAAMPTLTAPFSYQQFFGVLAPFNSSFPLVISDDGLEIRGFATSSGQNRLHTKIVVTLGAVPQFSLQDTTYPFAESGQPSFPSLPFQPSGTCSIDHRRPPDGLPIVTTATSFVRVGHRRYVSSLREEVPIGNRIKDPALGGEIFSYTREGMADTEQTVNEVICHAAGADLDLATGEQRVKFSVINVVNNTLVEASGNFARLEGGAFIVPAPNEPVHSTVMAPAGPDYPGAPSICPACQWSMVYSGFAPGPLSPMTTTSFRRGAATQLVRALTHRHADAVYSESAVEGQPFVTKFRGIDLAGKEYVADSSPLGEVFFATSDLSTVIHEPFPGTMRPLQIPANVVKLLAAVWL